MIGTKTKDADMEALQALKQPGVEPFEMPIDIASQRFIEKNDFVEGSHAFQGFVVATILSIPLWIAIIYFLGKVFHWF